MLADISFFEALQSNACHVHNSMWTWHAPAINNGSLFTDDEIDNYWDEENRRYQDSLIDRARPVEALTDDQDRYLTKLVSKMHPTDDFSTTDWALVLKHLLACDSTAQQRRICRDVYGIPYEEAKARFSLFKRITGEDPSTKPENNPKLKKLQRMAVDGVKEEQQQYRARQQQKKILAQEESSRKAMNRSRFAPGQSDLYGEAVYGETGPWVRDEHGKIAYSRGNGIVSAYAKKARWMPIDTMVNEWLYGPKGLLTWLEKKKIFHRPVVQEEIYDAVSRCMKAEPYKMINGVKWVPMETYLQLVRDVHKIIRQERQILKQHQAQRQLKQAKNA